MVRLIRMFLVLDRTELLPCVQFGVCELFSESLPVKRPSQGENKTISCIISHKFIIEEILAVF